MRERFAEAARAECVDLGLLCLLVGAEADASLDEGGLESASAELDRLAERVESAPDHVRWAVTLAEALGTRAGFLGRPADYQRLDSSLLHQVLRRRRGLPILLSVVWMEVGRRAGAPVHGVALPGHFVVGVGDPAGERVLADPFRGGRLMGPEDVDVIVAGATGAPVSPSMLIPADPLDIVHRILNNIRAWAAVRPEHVHVSLWAVELALLLPRHPARLRYERAQLLVKRGDFATAATELDAYADLLTRVDPPAAETVRRQARAARAMLN
ncbi:transglutaminase-like domain-containing protein [Wenjunlia tyrosinilytica]|jgi:regulator of sirC expression with transglutaminase-like and TPR domain|nr:transglutaminase-like domain-containing protein [Wenjunlia tyrosinilytica]